MAYRITWKTGWPLYQSCCSVAGPQRSVTGEGLLYLNACGIAKNIQTDTGLPGSFGDGSEMVKQPVALPAGRVNSNWILDDDSRGDDYVLQINLKADMDLEKVTLGRWDAQASQ